MLVITPGCYNSRTLSDGARSSGTLVLMMPCSASGHVPSRLRGRRVGQGCRSTTSWGADGVVTTHSPLQRVGVPPWNVVVVVCPCQVLRPEAEGGAYNTVGRSAHARNTIQALPCLEGSKRPSRHALTVLSCRGTGHGPRCHG